MKILNDLINGFRGAFKLLFCFDKDVIEIIWLSLVVSSLSTLISSIIGVPVGMLLGLKEFRGKKTIVRIINTLMGLPPVLAGLFVYITFSRKGPMGFMGILFTPAVMIIAQTLLVTPIITGIVMSSCKSKGKIVYEALFTLNADVKNMVYYLIKEMKYGITGAVTTGLGRAISEVGAVMLVGGNIDHKTRVMTTYIVLQTGMGNFDRAIAVGIVLLLIFFIINTIISKLSRENTYDS